MLLVLGALCVRSRGGVRLGGRDRVGRQASDAVSLSIWARRTRATRSRGTFGAPARRQLGPVARGRADNNLDALVQPLQELILR